MPYRLDALGQGLPDVEVRPSRVILRGFQGDGGAQASTHVVTNVPGARLRIVDAQVDGSEAERIAVTFSAVEPDPQGRSDRWQVEVAALPGIESERFSGRIRLLTDDAQTPELELTYAGL
jgi:hypothetical protein